MYKAALHLFITDTN